MEASCLCRVSLVLKQSLPHYADKEESGVEIAAAAIACGLRVVAEVVVVTAVLQNQEQLSSWSNNKKT